MKKLNLKLLIFGSAFLFNINNSFATDKLSDTWKEATIATRLNLNDILERYDIETEVSGIYATLSGHVTSDIEKQLAGEITKNVNGIYDVKNMIVVDENVNPNVKNSVCQTLADATTTAKVKSRLLWSSNVPGLNGYVKTSAGNVTLEGDVPYESQKVLAEKLTLNISGVRRVKNAIRVTNPITVKVGSIDFKKVENNNVVVMRSSDDNLTDTRLDAKVKASLNFTSSLSLDNLTVHTKSGVVTISGLAYNEADKQLAAEIVRDVKGVRIVINDIRVV